MANWARDGHGLWVLRTLHDLGPGEFIGVGGCNLLSETAWNLSFSLRPSAWGHGYAQEAAASGIAQALAVRPHLPITAVVARGNIRSHRAVERAGLQRMWQGPDSHDPNPAAIMTLYSDRALADEQISWLTS
ncbi:GNAT family N-acetyltransferase [Cryobacterium psychrotolerans]|uniref:GNAT family N-acetyltransferase n=1 Tax=Cryobacterium psychrotolerans TaxID=386301 RepID=UPI000B84B162|nr:N-acetyltransferase [Cryobacterium psychrotolerans]